MAKSPITTFGLRLEKGFARKFERDVMRELKKKIKLSGIVIAKRVENAIRMLMSIRLNAAPEVQSIASGELRAQFGLVDGEVRINSIIDLWISALNVTFIPMMGKLGGITVVMDEAFVENVINMPVGSFVTEKGSHLELLRWLLLECSAPIVGDYVFKRAPLGRTGQGVMINRVGSSWSVPAQFQGVEGNNFVTRAFENIEDDINAIIRREFTRAI